jgi:hypothetical protein
VTGFTHVAWLRGTNHRDVVDLSGLLCAHAPQQRGGAQQAHDDIAPVHSIAPVGSGGADTRSKRHLTTPPKGRAV